MFGTTHSRGGGSTRSVVASLVLAAIAAAMACASDSDCSEGFEGCECTADYRCLEGLVCLSERCVDADPAANETEAGETNDDDDGGEFDNVAACEDFEDSLECEFAGGVDVLMCDLYEETSCDVSDYFDCLADNTDCDGGMLDTTEWAMCAEMAECD